MRKRNGNEIPPSRISPTTDTHLKDERSALNIQTELRKHRAAKVAQFALIQRLERIEWEETVLKPELEQIAMEAGSNLSIPEFVVDHEDQDNN
jgi:hypothetical protein